MIYTQFVKEFLKSNPDLKMSYKDCMKCEEIKCAFKLLAKKEGCADPTKPKKKAAPKKGKNVPKKDDGCTVNVTVNCGPGGAVEGDEKEGANPNNKNVPPPANFPRKGSQLTPLPPPDPNVGFKPTTQDNFAPPSNDDQNVKEKETEKTLEDRNELSNNNPSILSQINNRIKKATEGPDVTNVTNVPNIVQSNHRFVPMPHPLPLNSLRDNVQPTVTTADVPTTTLPAVQPAVTPANVPPTTTLPAVQPAVLPDQEVQRTQDENRRLNVQLKAAQEKATSDRAAAAEKNEQLEKQIEDLKNMAESDLKSNDEKIRTQIKKTEEAEAAALAADEMANQSRAQVEFLFQDNTQLLHEKTAAEEISQNLKAEADIARGNAGAARDGEAAARSAMNAAEAQADVIKRENEALNVEKIKLVADVKKANQHALAMRSAVIDREAQLEDANEKYQKVKESLSKAVTRESFDDVKEMYIKATNERSKAEVELKRTQEHAAKVDAAHQATQQLNAAQALNIQIKEKELAELASQLKNETERAKKEESRANDISTRANESEESYKGLLQQRDNNIEEYEKEYSNTYSLLEQTTAELNKYKEALESLQSLQASETSSSNEELQKTINELQSKVAELENREKGEMGNLRELFTTVPADVQLGLGESNPLTFAQKRSVFGPAVHTTPAPTVVDNTPTTESPLARPQKLQNDEIVASSPLKIKRGGIETDEQFQEITPSTKRQTKLEVTKQLYQEMTPKQKDLVDDFIDTFNRQALQVLPQKRRDGKLTKDIIETETQNQAHNRMNNWLRNWADLGDLNDKMKEYIRKKVNNTNRRINPAFDTIEGFGMKKM